MSQTLEWVLTLHQLEDGTRSEQGLRFRHGDDAFFDATRPGERRQIHTDTLRARFFFQEHGARPCFILSNVSANPDEVIIVDDKLIGFGEQGIISDGSQVQIGQLYYTATLQQRPLAPLPAQRETSSYVESDRPQHWQVVTVCGIHQGLRRPKQEDALGHFYRDHPNGQREFLWVVADGLGGGYGGEIASDFAVRYIIYDYFRDLTQPPRERLKNAIRAANTELVNYGKLISAQGDPTYVATTVTAIVLHDNTWLLAHLGDSPAFYLKIRQQPVLVKATKEHGVEGRPGEIDYCLGNPKMGDHYKIDMEGDTLQRQNRLVLCSDGLYPRHLEFTELQSDLSTSSDLVGMAQSWMERALQRGGRDNIAFMIIAADVSDEPHPPAFKILSTDPRIISECQKPSLPPPVRNATPGTGTKAGDPAKRGILDRLFGKGKT